MKVNGDTQKDGKIIDSKPNMLPKISSTKSRCRTSSSNIGSSVSHLEDMDSNSTPTNYLSKSIEEKRKLIRKQLGALLHAVLCRVRDELTGNTEVAANSVSDATTRNYS